jgi:shikimate kinase
MKLVILGYMGVGKSIISSKLGSILNLKTIDLDSYIEKKESSSITDLFKNKGEIYFRIVENKYLKELLNLKEDLIIASGGGTPCYANNMEIINKNATSVYLKASIDFLYNRLIDEKKNRPLIKNIKTENLKEFIAKHLFERNNFYNKADKIIEINDIDINEIIKEVSNFIYFK